MRLRRQSARLLERAGLARGSDRAEILRHLQGNPARRHAGRAAIRSPGRSRSKAPSPATCSKCASRKSACARITRSTARRGFSRIEFTKRKTKIIPLDRRTHDRAFRVRASTFRCGRFSAAWASRRRKPPGKINSAPPGIHAGNLDNKELVAGTTLFIPVHAKGALFEVGDGHAGMGNGEIDITAMETSLTGVFPVHPAQGHAPEMAARGDADALDHHGHRSGSDASRANLRTGDDRFSGPEKKLTPRGRLRAVQRRRGFRHHATGGRDQRRPRHDPQKHFREVGTLTAPGLICGARRQVSSATRPAGDKIACPTRRAGPCATYSL